MASALLVGNATFVFCIVWTTVFRSSFYLHGPTKKIQGWSLDLLDILGQVEVTRGDLPFIWNDGVKQYFSCCFEYGVKMVSLINIVPSMPWIAVCQQHQENAESDTPFSYNKKNMCLQFLDHLINGTDVRFDKYNIYWFHQLLLGCDHWWHRQNMRGQFTSS